jgi:vacuolar-type H+-ATPase subunit I/STV1
MIFILFFNTNTLKTLKIINFILKKILLKISKKINSLTINHTIVKTRTQGLKKLLQKTQKLIDRIKNTRVENK